MEEQLIPNEWLQEEPNTLLGRVPGLLESNEISNIKRARKICEIVLTLDRENAGIVYLIASCYMRESRWAYAEHWFRRSLTMSPDFAPSWNNLGYCLQQEGRITEAKGYFDKAQELDPDQAEYANNAATLFVNNGTPEEAVERCTKVLELDPKNNDADWNRGLAYLELGMWKEGWAGYKGGLHDNIRSSQRRKLRVYPQHQDMPYWDGTEGQDVVLYGEQGVGDEILAASMLEETHQQAKIIYEAHPRLVNIMRHNFGDLFPIYGTRKVPSDQVCWPAWHRVDAKMPILGLGEYFRQSDADFPRKVYLKPFDSLVDKYRVKLRKLSSRPKIGISWKGGSVVTRHDLRSIPIDMWTELFKSIDADWISLQYDPADRMGWNMPIVSEFEEKTGLTLNHWPDVINDLDECYAGLIHALDLVITVNTSLVHACGGFGVPAWVLTPKRPAWRYNVATASVACGPERMIWYGDHIRQIRQAEDDWVPVLAKVQTELETWLEEVTAA